MPRALHLLVASAFAALVPAGGASAAFPGRNGEIAYAKYTEFGDSIATTELRSICPNGHLDRHVALGGKGDLSGLAFSPSGRRLAFSRESRLLTSAYNGRDQRRVGTYGDWPDWAPDGRGLVFTEFSSYSSGPTHVQVRRGGVTTQVAEGAGPAWSPKGPIAFSWKEARKPIGVYVVPALGQAPRRVATGSQPDWSPDGRRIVFTARSGRLALVRYPGGGVRRLTARRGSEPSFSPDGKSVAFTRGTSIYRIRLRRGVAHRVTPAVDPDEEFLPSDSSPDWRPLHHGTRTRC